MAAAMNGLALHGGFIPYGGTFLAFSDYSRPAIRLSALMRLRVIHVMTHDSIGLGEDGPTHQPVEHLAALRAIPNLWCSAPPTRSRRGSLGLRARGGRSPLACCACRARACRPSAATCAAGTVSRAAPTSSSRRTAARRDADGDRLGGRDRAGSRSPARDGTYPRRRRLGAVLRAVRGQPDGLSRRVLGTAPRVGIEAAVAGDWHRWIGATATSSA